MALCLQALLPYQSQSTQPASLFLLQTKQTAVFPSIPSVLRLVC